MLLAVVTRKRLRIKYSSPPRETKKKDSILPELQSKELQTGGAHDGPLFLRDPPSPPTLFD